MKMLTLLLLVMLEVYASENWLLLMFVKNLSVLPKTKRNKALTKPVCSPIVNLLFLKPLCETRAEEELAG